MKGIYIHIKIYQLHPASATTYCPSGITDAHSQTKERKITEKEYSRYCGLILEIVALTHQQDSTICPTSSKAASPRRE
jgi:hypothetical protein